MKMRIFLFILVFMSTNSIAQNLGELNAARYFDSVKKFPNQLYEFLYKMPKGADLHTHQNGATYAENMLRYAANDNLCVKKKSFYVFHNPTCAPDNLLNNAIKKSDFYSALVDAWSMRHFNPAKESGHDHFFNSFDKFFLISITHAGEILSELVQRAGKQNILYIEVMVTPDNNQSGMLGKRIGFNFDFKRLRERLLKSGLDKIVMLISENMTKEEEQMKEINQCKTQKQNVECNVEVRYLYQVLREQPPEMVFAQLLAGFEAAKKDTRIVGINMVQPEDGTIALRDYKLHMRMVGFLRRIYPEVGVSLHAGELTDKVVDTKDLKSHISDAVTIADAHRIGHGVDVAGEENSELLLKEMSRKKTLVEINLSSNAHILNVKGKDHPLLLYIRYGIPVALSTDDEGVARSNLTKEYQQAVNTYQFNYLTLKNLVRNSITYSFLPGQGIWQDVGEYQQVISPCANDMLGSINVSASCKSFLNGNEKANMQWELEHRFNQFEKELQQPRTSQDEVVL